VKNLLLDQGLILLFIVNYCDFFGDFLDAMEPDWISFRKDELFAENLNKQIF
jgi:hypothetical protein